ncbi:MAG TPA: hypothetical protein VG929_09080 [Actinomycetota bacterium]|nr:hypothetical protein [Actinomycetota bacterium]
MRVRSTFACLLLVGTLAPVGFATQAACASETGRRAALVVDLGDEGDVHRYCVALPRGDVSGLDLIELAGAQHGLTYEFGEGGRAVCMLAGVGASSDDCFGRYPYFWGYWKGDGSGGWSWSSTGAGSTLVQDGDVQGWSWGRGDNASSHPPPPATGFDSVCPPAARKEPKPAPKPERDQREQKASGREPVTSGAGPAAAPTAAPTTRPTAPARLGRKVQRTQPQATRGRRAAAPTVTAAPVERGGDLAAVRTTRDERSGFSVAAVAAIALTVSLMALAVVIMRRRAS